MGGDRVNPLDQPITFTIGKDHIIDIGDGKVRVEIGLTLGEFLDVCGIKMPKGRKKA